MMALQLPWLDCNNKFELFSFPTEKTEVQPTCVSVLTMILNTGTSEGDERVTCQQMFNSSKR